MGSTGEHKNIVGRLFYFCFLVTWLFFHIFSWSKEPHFTPNKALVNWMGWAIYFQLGFILVDTLISNIVCNSIYSHTMLKTLNDEDEVAVANIEARYKLRIRIELIWLCVFICFLTFLIFWSCLGMVVLIDNKIHGFWFGFSVIAMDVGLFLYSWPMFFLPCFCCLLPAICREIGLNEQEGVIFC
jgi:hypothetical protein